MTLVSPPTKSSLLSQMASDPNLTWPCLTPIPFAWLGIEVTQTILASATCY